MASVPLSVSCRTRTGVHAEQGRSGSTQRSRRAWQGRVLSQGRAEFRAGQGRAGQSRPEPRCTRVDCRARPKRTYGQRTGRGVSLLRRRAELTVSCTAKVAMAPPYFESAQSVRGRSFPRSPAAVLRKTGAFGVRCCGRERALPFFALPLPDSAARRMLFYLRCCRSTCCQRRAGRRSGSCI